MMKMADERVKSGLRDIYRAALAEAIMFLWKNASATENERIEGVLKMALIVLILQNRDE